jgi:hypothetical protein
MRAGRKEARQGKMKKKGSRCRKDEERVFFSVCPCCVSFGGSKLTLYVFIGSPSILTSSRCDENCNSHARQDERHVRPP